MSGAPEVRHAIKPREEKIGERFQASEECHEHVPL